MAEKIKFVLIVLLAISLGFWRLGQVPPSLNWDEAAISWNAKSIWYTHLDEFGIRFPISFKSFGDYKAPLYIYLTAPVVGLFGSSEITVRLVSVIAGIVSVVLMYFIGGPLAAGLLAISPWHILLSRPALEANLALMFILGGVWFFKLALKKPPWLILSAVSFIASLYSYQAPKIFVPVFVLGLLAIYRNQWRRAWLWLVLAGVLTAAAVLPIVKDGLGAGGRRFAMTSVFYQPGVNLPLTLAKNYLVHFSPAWLFWSSGETGRSQMKESGMLLLGFAPFLIGGLIYLWRQRRKDWSKLLFWWLLTAPLPAAIASEAPHAIRAYQLLPVLILITALGLSQISKYKLIISSLLALNAAFFLYHYFWLYPVESAPAWQYGYKQVALLAREQEDSVDKIIITGHYGQPHVFIYWYQNREPMSVLWGAMIKYLFRDIVWANDQHLSRVLIIGTPEEIPADAQGIIKEIDFPDGKVAFRVVKT